MNTCVSSRHIYPHISISSTHISAYKYIILTYISTYQYILHTYISTSKYILAGNTHFMLVLFVCWNMRQGRHWDCCHGGHDILYTITWASNISEKMLTVTVGCSFHELSTIYGWTWLKAGWRRRSSIELRPMLQHYSITFRMVVQIRRLLYNIWWRQHIMSSTLGHYALTYCDVTTKCRPH